MGASSPCSLACAHRSSTSLPPAHPRHATLVAGVVQHVTVDWQKLDDALTESVLEACGTAGCADGVAAEIVFGASVFPGPLNGAPLQQVSNAVWELFSTSTPDIPGAFAGANNHRAALYRVFVRPHEEYAASRVRGDPVPDVQDLCSRLSGEAL